MNPMNITADTNVLVRVAVQDDLWQAQQAMAVLQEAQLVAITLPTLCEFVWVLSRGYKKSTAEITDAILHLFNCHNVSMNRPAVEAGLALLQAGGDFADGVIAHTGAELGADEFVSFDQKAVAIMQAQGGSARLLGEKTAPPTRVLQQERAEYKVTRVDVKDAP
jgi:predicted nucleic-acid-binding protein